MSERRPPPSLMLVLCYLPFLGFIPLLAAKQNRELRWHALNGLLLSGSVAALLVVATVVGLVVPQLSCLYAIVFFVVLVLYAIIAILAIVKALEGERLIVPLVSRYADRF